MTQQIITIISVSLLSFIAFSVLAFIVLRNRFLSGRIVRSSVISIAENIDKVGIPFVTVSNGERSYNMLIDSGSNISYIDSRYLDNFRVKDLNQTTNTVGAGGTSLKTRHYVISFEFNSIKYRDMAGAIDLTGAFNQIKEESGIEIHGILGNNFFRYNHFVIDYDRMIFYRVKEKKKRDRMRKKKEKRK